MGCSSTKGVGMDAPVSTLRTDMHRLPTSAPMQPRTQGRNKQVARQLAFAQVQPRLHVQGRRPAEQPARLGTQSAAGAQGNGYSTLLTSLNERQLQDVLEISKKEQEADKRARLVSSLPKESYHCDHHKDLIECDVCLEDYVAGDELLRLPCMHVFHCKCVTPWLLKSGMCPACRTPLESGEAL